MEGFSDFIGVTTLIVKLLGNIKIILILNIKHFFKIILIISFSVDGFVDQEQNTGILFNLKA